jgi:hypothetical protein
MQLFIQKKTCKRIKSLYKEQKKIDLKEEEEKRNEFPKQKIEKMLTTQKEF